MVFYGFHGVHHEERTLGQRFIVSATLYTDDALDTKIRHLNDTVDYTKIYDDIKDTMESQQFQLLECCADAIAAKLLDSYSLLTQVKICIQKPSVPIQGSLKSVEVELTRARN